MQKSDMISKRSGTANYQVRVQVPLELQSKVGKIEIKRSLGTPDRKIAEARAPALITVIQNEIHSKVEQHSVKCSAN
jgi:hypothetical protein